MPASDPNPKNFLQPTVVEKFACQLRRALVSQVSAAIEIAGEHFSSNLDRKVVKIIDAGTTPHFGWTKVQLHPRVFLPEDIGVLWQTKLGDISTPPPSLVDTAEKGWKQSSGKVEHSILCHADDLPYLIKLKIKTDGHSERFSSMIALNTRRNKLASLERANFGNWQTYSFSEGPRTEFCAAAMYERSNGSRCLFAVPVAHHHSPEERGDWRSNFLRHLRQLKQFANKEKADLEICGPIDQMPPHGQSDFAALPG